RDVARVPDDFPEVTVGVAEVAGIDSPRAFVSLVGQGRAGFLGPRKQSVDLRPLADDVSNAELARGWRGWWDARVLRELHARIEREDQAASELEYHDCSSCFGVASFVLVGHHPCCRQAEPVTVE